MAGSHSQATPSLDGVLLAWLEALQLLADHIAERVLVVAPDLTILYADEGAWPQHTRGAASPPAKCYEAVLNQSDPCRVCAAKELFDAKEMRPLSRPAVEDGSACKVVRAFPLTGGRAQAEAVLMLLSRQSSPETAPPATPASRPENSPKVRTRLGQLMGRSAPMQDLFEMIELVADSHSTVLLQGESGTGKELVAKTIYQLSGRADRPFIVVDCGSLPESLLESELFGHVKGAFTGAIASKKGLFEEADGGTLFLDEIADTTPQFQAKLLRVVQEGEIKPVGSSRAIKVDVRIISATNKDLLGLTATKEFRMDLYYRLAVLPLVVPALRNRREDIPLLARHFMEMSCRRHGKPLREIVPSAMQALVSAPWPGNVRELQHVIERAVVMGGRFIAERDLFHGSATEGEHGELSTLGKRAVRTAERLGIEEALRHTLGNKTRAARLLKMSRASLYNKLRTYRLPS